MPKSKLKSKKHPSPSVEPPAPSLKERTAKKRKAQLERQSLITFTIFAVMFSGIVGLLLGLLGGGLPVGVGVTAALLVLTLSFRYPRQALWGFLIYVPFAGTITYYVGASSLMQLAKDAFYIPALFGTIQYCRREHLPVFIPKPLMPLLGILLALCLLTLFFVNGFQAIAATQVLQLTEERGPEYPFWLGVLGLKVFLGYIPLIICAYYLLRNKQDLYFLMRMLSVLAIICCALCFIQYIFLKTGRCQGTVGSGADLFKASLQARCFVGGSLLYSLEQGQIRLPGTFVAPWQWGWYLISSAFFTFATAFSDPRARWRTTGLLAMATVMITAVISGQRIALVLVPLIFAILTVLTGQVANLKRFIPVAVGLALLLGVAAVTNPDVTQQRWASFVSRWEASPPQQFIVEQFNQVSRGQQGLLGRGLGRATNSARFLGKTTLLESYYPKVLYEVGPLGVLAFLAVVTMLTILTFKAYRSVRDRNLRSYGACCWVFVLFVSYNTYYYPLDVDPVAVYYWFIAGVILRLPDLDRQERLQAATPDLPTKRKRRLRKAQEPIPQPST